MTDQVTTFAEMLAIIDLDAYVPLSGSPLTLSNKLRDIRHKAETGDNNPALEALADLQQPEIVRVFAAAVIDTARLKPEQLEDMGRHLLHDRSTAVQGALAKKLQDVVDKKSVRFLFQALIESDDLEVRAITAQAARKTRALTWEEKIPQLLQLVATSPCFRESLDISALVIALTPLAETEQLPPEQFRLADAFLAQAVVYKDDPRLTAILAALIIESCGRNLHRAIQRLNRYVDSSENKAETDTALAALKTELNSVPIPVELQETLKESYQKPLEQVQQEVRKKWKSSVVSAQAGLWARMLVNFLLSLGALWLLYLGGQRLLDQNQWPESFLSIGLGLALLLLSLISGSPVRETRQALVEISVANTVYATYAQRSLKISNEYTRLYLQNRLTTADVATSSQLLGDAMKESIQALRGERSITFEELIDQVLR